MEDMTMVGKQMKWIVVVGLALTGCSSSAMEPAGDDVGGGDDGGGPDAGVPEGTVTIERTGFFEDGARWLASTSGPLVQGSVGGNGTVVATLGGMPVAGVTTTAGHWSVKLPDGSLDTTNKPFAVRIEEVAGSEVTQALALDTSMPAIAAVPTSIRDERGDAITFQATGPVHAHQGTQIQLGGANCPSVFKYAYLTGAQAPMYGTETAPNPLAWKFHATGLGLDPQSAEYRVRDASHVVLDWTAMTADATGDFAVALYRDGEHAIPALGTASGNYFVDVRIRDWQAREVTASTCWDHHPLAAPIQVAAPGVAMGGRPLQGLTISSPLSTLVLAGTRTDVFEAKVTQPTAEPVRVHFAWTQPTGNWSTVVVNDWVAPQDQAAALDCGITCPASMTGCEPEPATDARCTSGTPADPADLSIGGFLPAGSWVTQVVDAATAQVVTTCDASGTCDLPGRAAGAPARQLVVRTAVNQLAALQPWNGSIGEYVLEGLPYTGLPPAESEQITRCATKTSTLTSRGNKITCTTLRTWTKLTAYDHLAMTFDAAKLAVTTSISATQPLAAPAYQPGAITGTGAAWDSGNSDLPGPH